MSLTRTTPLWMMYCCLSGLGDEVQGLFSCAWEVRTDSIIMWQRKTVRQGRSQRCPRDCRSGEKMLEHIPWAQSAGFWLHLLCRASLRHCPTLQPSQDIFSFRVDSQETPKSCHFYLCTCLFLCLEKSSSSCHLGDLFFQKVLKPLFLHKAFLPSATPNTHVVDGVPRCCSYIVGMSTTFTSPVSLSLLHYTVRQDCCLMPFF